MERDPSAAPLSVRSGHIEEPTNAHMAALESAPAHPGTWPYVTHEATDARRNSLGAIGRGLRRRGPTTAKQSPADKQIAQHVYDKLTADGVDRRHPRCDQSGGSDDSGTGREQPAEWLSHWEAQSSFTKTDRYFERRLQRGQHSSGAYQERHDTDGRGDSPARCAHSR